MSARDKDLALFPGLFDAPGDAIAIESREKLSDSGAASWNAEAALSALFDSVRSGILIFGPGGEVRAVNSQLAEMLGYEKRELLALGDFGHFLETLCRGYIEPDTAASRWRERYQAGMSCWDELECASPNRKHLERFGRPILAADGSRAGWLEVYSDVTGQKLMEGKIFQIERMVTLGQLVAGVAHELSNPLTSILGYAQLLRRRIHTYQGEEDVERILQEAERASSIAKSLLQFGRGGKPERGLIMLNDVARSVLTLRSSELARQQIEVRLELAPDLPAVLGDRGQLQQVLVNLLVNAEQAIRHSSCGGMIRVRTRREAGDRLALDVIDDGPGISPEALPRVFDPFFTTKPAGVGTGLGLSIAYGIAHDHGGSIAVDSRPGCGAAFTVELPAVAIPTSLGFSWEAAEAAADSVQSQEDPVRSERILVIEDEPTVAQLIADVLSEEGHRPELALDSRKGLSLISRKRYGLVLCDLRMPHVSGRSLFETLQKRHHPLCRRFVFVTGDALSPGVLQFLESTGVPFLAKPFLVDELKEVVRRALERRDAQIPWSASHSRSLIEPIGIRAAESWAIMDQLDIAPISEVRKTRLDRATVQLVCANSEMARRYLRELDRSGSLWLFVLALSAREAERNASYSRPRVTLLDECALKNGESLRECAEFLSEISPVIVVASRQSQTSLDPFISAGRLDFVPRSGKFVSVAAGLLERRMLCAKPGGDPATLRRANSEDFGEVLRHEVNNPLTGILGNAELLLARREHLPPGAVERLETIAELAVRLRETVRRLSYSRKERDEEVESV